MVLLVGLLFLSVVIQIFSTSCLQQSISAYYYTSMRDVFVSTMVLVGALLACYRAPALRDNLIAIVCGISAIGIGLFPMEPAWAAEIVQRHADDRRGRKHRELLRT